MNNVIIPQMETSIIAADNTLSGKINDFLSKKPVIMQLLRFAAIGVLNTALDFLVLNFISRTLGITSGFKLGQINVIGFALAVVQSYMWNRYWAFSGNEQGVTLVRNFVRLVLVGLLGAIALALVLLGASAPSSYFLIILGIYLISEVVLWRAFGLSKNAADESHRQQFLGFILVSVVGLIVNSVLLGTVSERFTVVQNAELNKNMAKILATGASLVWNFIGYKIFVFKK